jgi:hypothetical protein
MLLLVVMRCRHPLLLLLLSLVLFAPAPIVVGACRVLSVRSAVIEFVSGDYALAGYRKADGQEEEGGEAFSHNGRPVYVSTQEPRRYLYHIQVRLCLCIARALTCERFGKSIFFTCIPFH